MGLMLLTKSEGRILAPRKRTAIRKHRQVDTGRELTARVLIADTG